MTWYLKSVSNSGWFQERKSNSVSKPNDIAKGAQRIVTINIFVKVMPQKTHNKPKKKKQKQILYQPLKQQQQTNKCFSYFLKYISAWCLWKLILRHGLEGSSFLGKSFQEAAVKQAGCKTTKDEEPVQQCFTVGDCQPL